MMVVNIFTFAFDSFVPTLWAWDQRAFDCNRCHRYHDSPYPVGMGPKGGGINTMTMGGSKGQKQR